MRVAKLPFLGALVGLVPLCAFGASAEPDQERPNVILVITDDQGIGDYGFAGNQEVATPHLDAMASRSTWIPTFYVTPVCSTTRASLLTGRYHAQAGVVRNGLPMSTEAVTIAERLGESGYATGLFGKWHLGAHPPERPQDQGFEEVLTFPGGILRELEEQPTLVRYTDPTLLENGEVVKRTGYETDIFFESALSWIEKVQKEERPFLAVIATNAPHKPLDDVPASHLQPYLDAGVPDKIARVYAMVTKIDDNVGRLFARLDALELTEDTLVLFLSDNGGAGKRFSAGFSGGKSSVREGGIRTPLLAHWPGQLPARRLEDGYGAHVDLVPTLLEACSVPSDDELLVGQSLLPWWKGEAEFTAPGPLFFHANGRGDAMLNFAVRTADWKLVHADGYDARDPDPELVFLFDMNADPLETTNVAADHPGEVARLEQAYQAWKNSLRVRPKDLKEPAISIGRAVENPVMLTQRYPREGSSRWDLRAHRGGTYDIRVRFQTSAARERVTMTLKRGDGGHAFAYDEFKFVEKGASEAVFRGIKLEKGEWVMEARIRTVNVRGPGRGAWQAWIERK